MKIAAHAHCYGGQVFSGILDVPVSQIEGNWYLINHTEPIFFYVGPIKIIPKSHIIANIQINLNNRNRIAAEAIYTDNEAYEFSGLISTEDLPFNHQDIPKILVGDKTQITINYNSNNGINFIPDDQAAFVRRPIGYCKVSFQINPT